MALHAHTNRPLPPSLQHNGSVFSANAYSMQSRDALSPSQIQIGTHPVPHLLFISSKFHKLNAIWLDFVVCRDLQDTGFSESGILDYCSTLLREIQSCTGETFYQIYVESMLYILLSNWKKNGRLDWLMLQVLHPQRA